MKYATFSKSVFAVTAILIATACANSADVPEEGVAPLEPAPTSTAKPPPPPPPPPAAVCAPSCKTDSDCQKTCPVLAGGIQCCDTKSGKCVGTKASACAPPTPPPVDPPPAY